MFDLKEQKRAMKGGRQENADAQRIKLLDDEELLDLLEHKAREAVQVDLLTLRHSSSQLLSSSSSSYPSLLLSSSSSSYPS